MSQHECPPPGGGGIFVPQAPLEQGIWGVYYPWEIQGSCPAMVLKTHGPDRADLILLLENGDGEMRRFNSKCTQDSEEVQNYLQARIQYQAIFTAYKSSAKQAYEQAVEEPYSEPHSGGVLQCRGEPKLGSRGVFEAWHYPVVSCIADVIGLGWLLHLTHSTGNGWRTARDVRRLSGSELLRYYAKRDIWAPLYAQARADAAEEFGTLPY